MFFMAFNWRGHIRFIPPYYNTVKLKTWQLQLFFYGGTDWTLLLQPCLSLSTRPLKESFEFVTLNITLLKPKISPILSFHQNRKELPHLMSMLWILKTLNKEALFLWLNIKEFTTPNQHFSVFLVNFIIDFTFLIKHEELVLTKILQYTR